MEENNNNNNTTTAAQQHNKARTHFGLPTLLKTHLCKQIATSSECRSGRNKWQDHVSRPTLNIHLSLSFSLQPRHYVSSLRSSGSKSSQSWSWLVIGRLKTSSTRAKQPSSGLSRSGLSELPTGGGLRGPVMLHTRWTSHTHMWRIKRAEAAAAATCVSTREPPPVRAAERFKISLVSQTARQRLQSRVSPVC